MSDKSRRTVTTIETHEVLIVRKREGRPAPLCAVCRGGARMLTMEEAAFRDGVSQRTVYGWVEDGRIHFTETPDGGLFVCLEPLYADDG